MSENTKNHNGNYLYKTHYDSLIQAVKAYYLPLKIFSCWLLFLILMGIIGFTYNLFFDESFNEGLFQEPAIKAFMMIISYGFLSLLLIGVLAIFTLPQRIIKRLEQSNFDWYESCVQSVYRRRHETSVWVDGKIITCLCFSEEDYMQLREGFPVYVIIIKNMRFAIPKYLKN